MKRKSVWVSVVLIMTILCTSCGTKLPEAGDYTEANGASGSAVGSAPNTTGTGEKESIYDRLPFTNDENSYAVFDDEVIQESLDVYDVDSVRRFPMKKEISKGGIRLFRVYNKEIFIVNQAKELWRIPLGKDKKGNCLQMDKAEKVLTDKNDIIDVYGTDEYILYISDIGLGVYNEYDRKSGKKVTVDREGGASFATYAAHNIADVIGGEYILLGSAYKKEDKDDSASDLIQEGVYIHKLGSGSVTKIDDLYNFETTRITMEDARAFGGKIYYYGGWRREESNEVPEYDEAKKDIQVYDALTGKRETFVSEEQLIQGIQENKIPFTDKHLRISGIYIDGGRLYICATTYSEYAMFSRTLDGDSKLQYEKKASKFLNNTMKGASRDMKRDMIDGKLFITCYDERYVDNIRYAYYDFAKGTVKDIVPGDKERYYWHYSLRL